VGPSGFDDAGAVRSASGKIRLYSTDFFPPVVDDPAAYGAIAAANALSDIWAMGGEPDVVLNLAGFPEEWEEPTLSPIFAAAAKKVQEAGALWVGGHTVRSQEPLFGFAVFGEVEENQLMTNQGARPGDLLYLTKPLGTGSITTSVSRGEASDAVVEEAQRGMAHLNKNAAHAARQVGVKAGTDITGFGLLGHAANLASASGVRLLLRALSLPFYEGAAELAAAGVFSGGSSRGRISLEGRVQVASSVPEWVAGIGFDAETSGGLLLAIPPEQQEAFLKALPEGEVATWVGEVEEGESLVALG
jgi:selenide,water dikinase|tara:strand:- start:94 stop:1002 length:909 start_codon:yes stop_codon:yes gene_type:complete